MKLLFTVMIKDLSTKTSTKNLSALRTFKIRIISTKESILMFLDQLLLSSINGLHLMCIFTSIDDFSDPVLITGTYGTFSRQQLVKCLA